MSLWPFLSTCVIVRGYPCISGMLLLPWGGAAAGVPSARLEPTALGLPHPAAAAAHYYDPTQHNTTPNCWVVAVIILLCADFTNYQSELIKAKVINSPTISTWPGVNSSCHDGS